jgi:hypothetical protein
VKTDDGGQMEGGDHSLAEEGNYVDYHLLVYVFGFANHRIHDFACWQVRF